VLNPQTLKGHLDLLLLSVVADSPGHGYSIAEALRARTDAVITLGEGTLYPALHRLEAGGVISGRWLEVNGRRRRVYQLTANGKRALTQKRQEWNLFARTVYAVVGGRP
jgi:PadR family transcriptional regulator